MKKGYKEKKDDILQSPKERIKPFTPHFFQTKIEGIEEYEIVLEHKAFVKLFHLINLAETDEVGWLCSVEREDNLFFVTDVFLFPQEVHGSTTEITPEGLGKVGYKILNEYENGKEILNSLRLWGHLHPFGTAEPSGQDDEQLMSFKKNGLDWFIRLIVSKERKLIFTLVLFEFGIKIYDVPWKYLFSDIEELKSEIEKDFKEMVKKKVYDLKSDYSWLGKEWVREGKALVYKPLLGFDKTKYGDLEKYQKEKKLESQSVGFDKTDKKELEKEEKERESHITIIEEGIMLQLHSHPFCKYIYREKADNKIYWTTHDEKGSRNYEGIPHGLTKIEMEIVAQQFSQKIEELERWDKSVLLNPKEEMSKTEIIPITTQAQAFALVENI